MLLFTVLSAGILTMWVPSRWALTAFQLAIFALAAARVGRPRVKLPSEPTLALLAFPILWGLIQFFAHWTVDPFRTLEETLNWFTNLTAFALALDYGAQHVRRERFLTSLTLFATVLAVLAMLTVFSSPPGVIAWTFDTGTGVPTLGPFVYRNQYAAFVEVVLPILLVRSLVVGESAWLYLAGSALLYSSVIAAGSRAGAVLCTLEVLAIPAVAWARGFAGRRTVFAVSLGSLAAIGIFTLVVGWQALWTRFQEPNPYGLRWDLLRSSIEMFKARPWTGFGLGTWPLVYPGFAFYDDGTYVNQAHNDWAQWAVEGGIPLFATLFAVAVRAIPPAVRAVWPLGLIAVLLHAGVDYPFQQRPALSVLLFCMLGLAASAASVTRSIRHDA